MNDNNHQTITENNVLDIELDVQPNTDALQQRILQATQNMPQGVDVDEAIESKAHIVGFNSTVQKVASLALVACLVLVAIIWVPGSIQDNPVEQFNEISADEIEFQEAMLLHDEYLFAQL